MSLATELGRKHLQAELARIDLLIRREMRRWQLSGQDPADNLRGLYISSAKAESLLSRPFGSSWGGSAGLDPKETKAFAAMQAAADRQLQAIAETARAQGQVLRLHHMAAAFQLDRFDLDAFLIAVAPTLDLRYERLYGYLQDDVTRKRPSVSLVIDLLCEPGPERMRMLSRFSDDGPLFSNRLLERAVEPGLGTPALLGQSLLPDESIVAWLLGEYRPHADLGRHATLLRLEDLPASAADRLLAAEAWPDVERALGQQSEMPIVVSYGPDRAGQRAMARQLASHLRRPILEVNLAGVIGDETPPVRALKLALRDARLTGALPLLGGWDACLASSGEDIGSPPSALLAELCAYPGLVIVAGRAPWQPGGIDRERQFLRLEFPVPDYARRHALWNYFLDHASLRPDDPMTYATESLAAQFLLTTDQIRDAVASAKDLSARRGSRLEIADLFAAARAHSNPNLSGLARKIVPRYQWPDLILPDDQLAILHEIVATVRGRPLVLEEWGIGKKLAASNGVTILFAGPPGTGKTMAAEVIAGELGLDLYKIELSTIVSKYIGETEKNLERIFSEAQSSNAILFFDEADAIFGKRSEVKDAHDRYANIEVSYLLQRMEAYDGVTILATNLRANLDEAFTRRLQFAVDFPFPDEIYRIRIWETLFPPDVPLAHDLDLGLMARRFKLAGGNIRNIIVNAAFLAAADGGALSMSHLLHGARRELQKMGRLVNEKDVTHQPSAGSDPDEGSGPRDS